MRMTEKQHLRPGFTRSVLGEIGRISDIMPMSVNKQDFVTGKLGEDFCRVGKIFRARMTGRNCRVCQ